MTDWVMYTTICLGYFEAVHAHMYQYMQGLTNPTAWCLGQVHILVRLVVFMCIQMYINLTTDKLNSRLDMSFENLLVSPWHMLNLLFSQQAKQR